MRAVAIAALALIASACTSTPAITPGTVSVTAKAETQPVGTVNDDAADDPAIWRNAADPAQSLIVATDKKAGLHVYGLDGVSRHFLASGLLNNVDLVDLGNAGVIVAASDRNDPANARIQLFRLDTASARLEPIGTAPGGAGEGYGLCLWQAPDGLHAYSVVKEGGIHQVRLDVTGAQASGEIVRTMQLATQPEGCVVDRRNGTLYVGEEGRGIWRFDARADAAADGTLVAPLHPLQLHADVEGLALAPVGDSGGYLVASSQGDNAFAIYQLPDMQFVGRFNVVPGAVGSVEETDGIDLALGTFGPDYPGGLMVAQDGMNAPYAQNFKLISWADVVGALGLQR